MLLFLFRYSSWISAASFLCLTSFSVGQTVTFQNNNPQISVVAYGGAFTYSVTWSSSSSTVWFESLHNPSGSVSYNHRQYPTSYTFEYPISGVSASDAGAYSILVSYYDPHHWSPVYIESQSIVLYVAPAVLIQPAETTILNGAATSMGISAGPSTATFQWIDAASGSVLATGTSFTASTGMDGKRVYCKISNSYGTVSSGSALLHVGSAPGISSQPASVSVAAGQNATFNISASGTAPLTYAWYKGGILIPGANLSILALFSVVPTNAATYSCVVSNSYGKVTSANAVLTVINTYPVIQTQPTNQSVPFGQSATLFIEAAGAQPLTYAWYKNGAAIPAANFNYYTIATPTNTDAATYACTVSNVYGITNSANAVLKVGVPFITSHPSSLLVTQAQSATFVAAAESTTALYYSWLGNGHPVPGATNLSYTIPNATPADEGSYAFVASNAMGAVTSAVANLTVYYPPSITIQPVGGTCATYSDFTLSASADPGKPIGLLQWRKNGAVIADATSPAYTLAGAVPGDSGYYDLIVSNLVGSATSIVAHVSVVNLPPSITAQPVGTNVLAGNSISLAATAEGTAPLAYQWFRDSLALTGADAPTLTLTNVTLADAGVYSLTVSNMAGTAASSSAVITVGYAPLITEQPASATNAFGSTARFTCSASGPEPIAYQWQCNGQTLAGATNFRLTLTNLHLQDAGSYQVRVSSVFGSVTSATAVLHISPGFVVQPDNLRVMPGAQCSMSGLAGGEIPIGYQWCLDGTNLADMGLMVGSQSNVLAIVAAMSNATGEYTLVATNAFGSATSSVAALRFGTPSVAQFNYSGFIQPFIVPAGVSNLGVMVTGASGGRGNPGQAAYPGNVMRAAGVVQVAPTDQLLLSVGQGGGSGLAGGAPLAGFQGGSGVCCYGGGGGAATVIQMPDLGSIVLGGSGGSGLSYNGLRNGWPSTLVDAVGTNTAGSSSDTGGGGGGGAVGGSGGGSDQGGGWGGGSLLPSRYLATQSQWTFRDAGSGSNGCVVLVLNPVPTILEQPVSKTVVVGNPVTFDFQLTTPWPIAYQWFRNGSLIENATNSSLTLLDLTPQSAASFCVTASNDFVTVTSAVAVLSVAIPVYLLSQPESQTVPGRQSLRLSVTAAGTPPLSYQWYKQPNTAATADPIIASGFVLGASITSGGSGYVSVPNVSIVGGGGFGATATAAISNGAVTAINIVDPGFGYSSLPGIFIEPPIIPMSDQTNADLAISSATEHDTGTYFVVVTNNYGSVNSHTASLTVNMPVYITAQPQSQTVVRAHDAGFSVSVSGSPAFSYQWYRSTSAQRTAGARALLLNGFVYGAVITNSGAGYTAPPALQILGGGGSGAVAIAVVSNGCVVAINFTRAGSGYSIMPTIQIDPPPAVLLAGRTNAVLTITGVTTNDVGKYYVSVTNAYGNVTSTQAFLAVVEGIPPTITSQPLSQHVLAGTPASLIVSAVGTPEISYQWQKNGLSLPAAILPNYSIATAGTNDTGLYLVVVTNSYGSVTSAPASLLVGIPPQRLDIGAAGGKSVTLHMAGTPGFPYAAQTSSNLSPPVLWTWLLTNTADVNGDWWITVTNLSSPQQFYRLTVP